MKRSVANLWILLLAALLSTYAVGAIASEPRSYLQLPESGRLTTPPHVIMRATGNKHLLVMGTLHLHDPGAPMYTRISNRLARFSPQVILHEGVVPDGLGQLPRARAIAVGADLGFVANYAHANRIPLISADAPQENEVRALLERHSADEVLVFLVSQRLIGGARNPDLRVIGEQYPEFHASLVRLGLPVMPGHAQWTDYLRVHARITGRQIAAEKWSADMINPTLRAGGRLNDLVRSSNAVRDQFLIASIDRALRRYDRVAVVFGAWHVLAVEPVLWHLDSDPAHPLSPEWTSQAASGTRADPVSEKK